MEEYKLFGGGVVSGLSPDMKPIHINLKDHLMEVVKVVIQENLFGSICSIIIFENGNTARFIGDVRKRTDVVLRDKNYKL